ncbi:MAG: outer membrane lipid asymmetry maintenance protein MlaD [Succinivibrionaceae bacterium]|nr:outer membrane lipid asymmetry maintenance protein MlaD [Succinivibrionaceae bacterium]
MKTRRTEILVGLFMLLGIIAAVVLSLKVAGLVLDSSSDTYTLKARFANVGSLKLRAPVRVGGVLIGRVERITLDGESLTPVVEMAISTRYDHLSSESQAAILTAGIIGEQYVGVTPGFYDEDMGTTYLKDGDTIENTNSALAIEELLGKFLYNSSSDK